MPDVVLTIGEDGKPTGLTEEDNKAYALWRKRIRALQPGRTIAFSWSEARAPKVHAAYFKCLNLIFENQEAFITFPDFREWVERGARHVEIFTQSGVEFERVLSIKHDELDDDAFRLLFSRAKSYLLTAEALHKLWPHVKTAEAYEGALAILEGKAQ
jgi:sugar/nucleoside kinase (ribokinase family)